MCMYIMWIPSIYNYVYNMYSCFAPPVLVEEQELLTLEYNTILIGAT